MKKLATALVVLGLAFGSLSAANTVWNTGPYKDFDNRMQVLSVPGAKALKVTIQGATECGYDYIYIYDSCGRLVAKLSGNINKTVYVQGDSIIAKLRADDTYTDRGVVVSVAPTDTIPVVTTTAYEDSCGCLVDPDRDPSAGPVGPDPDTDPSIRGMTPDPDVDPSLR